MRAYNAEPKTVPSDYRKALQSTMLSFRKDMQLKGTETAIVAAFDAATTGRLALTYYNEVSLPAFLDLDAELGRSLLLVAGKYGIQAQIFSRLWLRLWNAAGQFP